VLSEREDHTLVFLILGLVMVSHELYLRGLTERPAPGVSTRTATGRLTRAAEPQPQY